MRTRAIIHLDRLTGNINKIKDRIGSCKICAVVKADAYGHGAPQVAKAAVNAGVYCLGVVTTQEGAGLRKNGITAPVLLFSNPHPDEIQEIINFNLIPFISDISYASILNEQAKLAKVKLKVHLKIDTGMNRLGCKPEEAVSLACHIADCAALELAGTATHFAVSDSIADGDRAYTRMQIECFKRTVGSIKSAGIDPGILHAANSGGVILHPESWLDMVRPGLLMYGYKPVEEYADFPHKPIEVQPVMELRASISLIKKVKQGESVSYGRIWTAPEDTNIAIITAGYSDGLPRSASGKWKALIGGKYYPIAGRICMDQCCVDLGQQTDIGRWDEAVLFGSFRDLNAATLAAAAGTIPYEITCNVNKRVPRVYTTGDVALYGKKQ